MKFCSTACFYTFHASKHCCGPTFKGEAVRLARQLPSNMTRQEVEESLSRMTQLFGEDSRTCIHGRPFLHQLSVVPCSEQEAKSLLLPIGQL